MKNIKSVFIFILTIIMLFTLLVSCTKNNEVNETQETSKSQSDAGEEAEGTETNASAIPTDLVIANYADIDDFNPFTNQMTDFIGFFVFNCYEPLFHLNSKMEYEMDLATEVKQTDDTTVVITTREGVKFHEGQEFGPEDVVFTIEQTLNESTGAWRASQYAEVDSVEVTGENEVTIKLKKPTPAFLDNLAYTPIVSKDADMTKLSTSMNGTGAYKFVEWIPNDSINLEKNQEYWDADKVQFEK